MKRSEAASTTFAEVAVDAGPAAGSLGQPSRQGRFAALTLPILLPLLVYYLWLSLDSNGGAAIIPRSGAELISLVRNIPTPTPFAAVMFIAWFSFQAALQALLPGRRVVAPMASNPGGLEYRLNGWLAWWTTWACFSALVAFGWLSPTLLADNFGALLSTANIVAFALSVYLVWRTRHKAQWRSRGVDRFFMGSELNPRIGDFDLKLFLEARPGLIGWCVLDVSLLAKQYELNGAVSASMLLVVAFQVFYVADYFFHEEAILSTWDIKHERLGWMLCWGDLVWVPFVYSLQAVYLLHHPVALSPLAIVGLMVLNSAGYVTFRMANLQKLRFRQDPSAPIWGRPPEIIKTPSGNPLLASGCWGMSRHLNYFGDLLMGLAWCLACGFDQPLVYFYIVFFTLLLVHRERRDDAHCAGAYGTAWEAYRRRVPWRIVPWVY
ncbi:MAG: delta(24(24(1)))-sterol reductase [Chloroflexota bacterium]